MKTEEPKQHVEFINNNIDQLDKAIESFKQETLEEVSLRLAQMLGTKDSFKYIKSAFELGAKWQQEQDKNKYSEEEVEIIIQKLMNDVHCGDLCYGDNVIDFKLSPRQWFEQFKNK